MKKIYSLLLTAAALLVGINAWAGTYNVGTPSDFESAWEKSKTEDVVINLTSSGVNLSKTMWLGTTDIDGTAHSVEINLNGFPLTSSAKNAFILTHGTLKFSGNGQVTGSGAGEMIYITGSINKDVDPSKSVEANNNKPYFSHLIVGEGVTIANTAYYAAISIDGVRKSSDNLAYAKNTNFIPSKDALTYLTNVYAKAEANSAKYASHGVRLDIHGIVNGTKYGIKSNGDLGNTNYFFNKVKTAGNTKDTVEFSSTLIPANYKILATDDQYCPFIYIHPTARVTADAQKGSHDKSPVALYASGFARWQVEGYVSGSVGALVKSGEVNFEDATVVGTGETYGASTPTTSGTTACGSAIAMESNSAYTGDISVTVGGDTKVSATNGYAIDEAVVTNDGKTAVDAITINGGTFVGGQTHVDPTDPSSATIDLVMNVSDVTAAAAASTEEETTITIIGATTNSQDGITIGTQTLADFLSDQGTETHLTEVVTENGSIWVISEGEAPVNQTQGVSSWVAGSSINWKNTGVLTTPMKDSIEADLKLTELQMNQSYAQTLKVKDGVTFEVGTILMGVYAQIIVEAGGTFIVSGDQGITAPKTENIILRHNSNTGKYATFLFNPAVSSNKHPNATVEFTSKSWRESSNVKQWEWFGVPTYNAVKSIAATCPAYVAVYDNGDWQDIGLVADISASEALRAKLNKPFAAYDLLANRARTAAAPTITITGEMVGNVNAVLKANQKWNPFANSYTAEVDAEAFVNALSGNISAAIYLAKQNNNGTITWELKAEELLEDLKLRPMQAFLLLNNNEEEDATINYTSMVYNPATIPANNTPAPRRTAAKDYSAKVTINVVNEEGTWDDVDLRENANAKSYEKYLNSDVNIYVLDGEKNDYVAVNDLEDMYIGFSTVNGGNFTISFAKAEGREFDLIDLETGAKVAVAEGETYSFNAAANFANDYRFKLVERAKMPTAIENTEVEANVKGIYTITGQYLGEMNVWNTLPAGIYVVNGTKLVK